MSKLAKALSSAAGNAGGDSLYVEDVFSTYLYDGTATTQVITNGLDLDGEGGLVWFKNRTAVDQNCVYDTERGAGKVLFTDTTGAQLTNTGSKVDFNTDGFDTGTSYGGSENGTGKSICSWSFRKAPGFFDVVTYTGNGTAGRTLAHSLGSAPGFVMIKRTNTSNNWIGWHRALTNTQYIQLNSTAAAGADGGIFWNSTTPDADNITLGSDSGVNGSGSTYIAYIFAHDAQVFGAGGDESIIKCGSFTFQYNQPNEIDVGFEPQWILYKAVGMVDNWNLLDTMRGWTVEKDNWLYANTSGAEGSNFDLMNPTSTGFKVNDGSYGQEYIYIAIRRPMKVPESGTEVFAAITRTGTGANATITGLGFNPDEIISQTRGLTYGGIWFSRLRGGNQALYPPSTAAEYTSTNCVTEFSTNGYKLGTDGSNQINSNTVTYANWCFKRAPSFMDVVCYTGTGSPENYNHNLGVVPEMMITKARTGSNHWNVYNADKGNNFVVYLNSDYSGGTDGGYRWNQTTPTASVFTNGTNAGSSGSGVPFVAYLFATLAGVSKVGSYTGTAASLDLDMGFTGGARFFLCKRTDATGDWYTYDSARGIVAGNDPYLLLNTTAAEVTNTDYVDPLAAGITLTAAGSSTINVSGGSYIFLAIA